MLEIINLQCKIWTIQDQMKIHLIQNQEYCYQIQTQFGAWNKKYCNVFVYTSQEYYLQRINFKENFSTKLVEVVINFWKKIISQKRLYKNIYTKFYINSSEHKDENKMRTLKWIVECLPLQDFLLKSFFTFVCLLLISFGKQFKANSIFIPPENIRKPLLSWCFQGI